MKTTKPSNRDHVVAVAAELFLQRGLANTSMDDVVRESGVSKSNIYYHFSRKEDLVLAVVEWRIRLLEVQVEQLLRLNNQGVLQRLETYLKALVDELTGRNCVGGCPFVSLVTQSSQANEAVRQRIGQFFREQAEQIEGLIAEGVEKGEVRSDVVPLQAAMLILSAIEGGMVLAETYRSTDMMEQANRLLLTLLRPVSGKFTFADSAGCTD